MTSSGNDPQAAVPDDPDPVRLTPAADPWLADAPTSVVGDATLRNFEAAPPADTTPFAAADGGRSAGRDRRVIRWILAVLAVCALVVAGLLVIDPFGPENDGGAQGSDPSIVPTPAGERPATADVTTAPQPGAEPAGRPDSSAVAAAPEVIYEVTASGSRNTGSVSYTDQDGEIIRRNGIPLPWRTTFPVGAQRKPLVINAQRKGGGDAGPVTCTITVGGKLLSSTTATGKYAATLCSGSG